MLNRFSASVVFASFFAATLLFNAVDAKAALVEITVSESLSGTTLAFEVQQSPTPTLTNTVDNPNSFTLSNVPTSIDGGVESNENITFFAPLDPDNPSDLQGGLLGGGVSIAGTVLFTGSVSDPTFTLGVLFPESTKFTVPFNENATVTISAVAATPIPAALPLFATGLGVLGLLGWRRKRNNTAALAA
jgi:hypothetical protein